MSWRADAACALIIGLAVLAAPTGLSAQPRLAVQPDSWNVDYGDLRCSLGRRLGGAETPIMVLSSYLGRDEPELVLIRDGKEPLPELPQRVQVVLAPSNQVEQGRVQARLVKGGRILTIRDLREGFMDRFAASEAVTLMAGGRALAVLRTPGAAAAVAALRACNDDLLRSWDIPPPSTYSRPARRISGSISSFDYPPSAMSREQSGVVVARHEVDVNGRVTRCAPVVASPHAVLNAQTCALIVDRFRYEPALDLQGNPVAAMVVTTVRWETG